MEVGGWEWEVPKAKIADDVRLMAVLARFKRNKSTIYHSIVETFLLLIQVITA